MILDVLWCYFIPLVTEPSYVLEIDGEDYFRHKLVDIYWWNTNKTLLIRVVRQNSNCCCFNTLVLLLER